MTDYYKKFSPVPIQNKITLFTLTDSFKTFEKFA